MMTVNDFPKYLALGYLLNQNMISKKGQKISKVEYDDDLNVVIVRKKKKISYQEKIKKRILTSGCAQGTLFGDLMDNFSKVKFNIKSKNKNRGFMNYPKLLTLHQVFTLRQVLYMDVFFVKNKPLIYMEDVGRHV